LCISYVHSCISFFFLILFNHISDPTKLYTTTQTTHIHNKHQILDIKISNARQLRAQLREIAPMNNEGSKIFCPNGASAAVSPLMENKCGDRQALPSVYGRADDAMGNSVPGFAVGSADGGGSSSSLRAELNAQSYFRPNDDR
jgi:hypothetical protein